jgi:O-antigen/teichoic acid export membrane protein
VIARIARRSIAQVRQLAGKLFEVVAAMVNEVVQILSLMIVFPIVARELGPDGYGKYTTLYTVAGFAITWAYASVAAALVQLFIQRHRAGDLLIRTGRRQVLVITPTLGIFGMVAAVWLLGTEVALPALIVLGPELLIAGIFEVHLSILFALRGATFTTRIRVIGPILRTLGVVILAWTDRVEILSLVVVNAVATSVMMCAAIYAVRVVRAHDSYQQHTTPTSTAEVRSLSTIYAASMSANVVQGEGEKLVMASFRPIGEVGQYQAAYRFVSLSLIPLNAVYAVATRWFLPKDDRPNAHVDRALRLSAPLVVYGVVAALLIVVAQPIVKFVLGEGFDEAATMTAWLCLLPLLRSQAEIPTLGLLGLGKNRQRMWFGVASAAFALIVYLILVPPYGWRGAVVGTYVSEIATLIGGWMLLVRYQRSSDR